MYFLVGLALTTTAMPQAEALQNGRAGLSLMKSSRSDAPDAAHIQANESNLAVSSFSPGSLQAQRSRVGHKRKEGSSLWKEYELDGHSFFVNRMTGEERRTRPTVPTIFLEGFSATDSGVHVRQDLMESSKVFDTVEHHRMERVIQTSDITLAFQGDVNRLEQLRVVAEKWQGPISASILVLESEISHVDQIFVNSPALRQNVDLNLCVTETRWTHYPVNTLRNHANSYARTEYLFVMDGDEDCVQSMDLFRDDLQQSIASTNADPGTTAFIVTSWQWAHKTHADGEYPRTKADLSRLLQEGKAECKHAEFPQAYMPLGVSLDEWIGTDTARRVSWHDRYEPMVVRKDAIDVFDERFVGWGGNNAIHALKMQLDKIHWVLLPHAFTFTKWSIVDDNAKQN